MSARGARTASTAARGARGSSGSSTGRPAVVEREQLAVEPRGAELGEREGRSVPSTAGRRGHAAMLRHRRRAARRSSTCGRDAASRGELRRSGGLSRRRRSSQALRASSASCGVGDRASCRRAPWPSRARLELRDRVVQLAGEALGAGLLLGVVRAPVVVVELAHGVSTLRRRSSTALTWSRGTLPISSQRRWMPVSVAARLRRGRSR